MEALESIGGLNDSTVSCKLGLRREHIQLLSNGDSRHSSGVHERHTCLLGSLYVCLTGGQQAADPTDHNLVLEVWQVLLQRRCHGEEDLACINDTLAVHNLATNVRIRRVRESRKGPGTAFNIDDVTLLDHCCGNSWCHGNTCLASWLLDDATIQIAHGNPHRLSSGKVAALPQPLGTQLTHCRKHPVPVFTFCSFPDESKMQDVVVQCEACAEFLNPA
mmetsp:Transcript_88725/g.153387  ORF Transcript_88725/g.153387 Transcript_88725/m.153387 type:complete len:219 (+) Transcript_88725:550-1206(+)